MIEKDIDIKFLSNIFSHYKEDYDFRPNEFTKVYTYIVDEKIVGFIIFDIIYEKCEIIDIFIEENYRRKGIAILLIKEIEKDFSIENITLEVREDNIPAIKLYEKIGFKKVSIRKNYYKNINELLMLKEIR